MEKGESEVGCEIAQAEVGCRPQTRTPNEECVRRRPTKFVGEELTMNTAARRGPLAPGTAQRNELLRGERRGNPLPLEEAPRSRANDGAEVRSRVYVAAENRL